jgi:hypothetical protein
VARAAPAVIKFIKSFFISKKSEQHGQQFADNGRTGEAGRKGQTQGAAESRFDPKEIS